MAQLKDFPVSVCGAGALGANIIENLARSGAGSLVVIDRDRIIALRNATSPLGLLQIRCREIFGDLTSKVQI